MIERMDANQQFYHLSCLITGFNDLSYQISVRYYASVSSKDGYKEHLPALLNLAEHCSSAEELIKLSNNQQKACCKGIVFLWYVAELISWASANSTVLDINRINPTEDEYYSGLIWRAIRAHPLALSGGYYGYWKYEPEN